MHARQPLLVAVLMAGSLASGCTLCKPVVGAVAGPVVLLGASGGDWGCGCHDGRAVAAVLIVAAGVGAAAGLVTGVISDVQALSGAATDPCRNWWHPFATNTDG
jgi:hypothetical protein